MNRQFKLKKILPALFVGMLLFSWWFSPSDKSALLAAAHQGDRPNPTAIAQVEPAISVTTQQVNYATVDGKTVKGYLARPKSTSHSLPGIIVINEWWGLNDNIKSMTRRLAGEGYQALAVDLYNGQVAISPAKARQLTQSVQQNAATAKANLQQAYEYLVKEQQAPKVGVIGWCFGGSWSLQTALLFPQDIDATVIYYGGEIGKATAQELSTLQMPILGIFGAEDESIPIAQVRQFKNLLNQLNKKADIQIYENAGHAFANPSGERYVPEAAEKAWAETVQFLAQNLAS